LLNRPFGDRCSKPGKPSQADRGPKKQGRSTPLTRDIKNFFDQTHYKDSVAQFAEAQIADAVATLEHGPGTH
jgi:hypothetical protein